MLDSPVRPSIDRPEHYSDFRLLPVFASFLWARQGQFLPNAAFAETTESLDGGFERLLLRGKESGVLPPDCGRSQIRSLYRIFKNGLVSSVRQLSAFDPEPCQQEIVFLSAVERMDPFEEIFPGAAMQWQQLTGASVQVHEVPGNHYSMLLEPHVRVLGGAIARSMHQGEIGTC
jgi:thioesterase domain-containing protein